MLQHSRLSLDGDEMTDDQRDAMCNIGESLGLTGGQAEDLIDEYLEAMASMPIAPAAPLRAVRSPTAPRPGVTTLPGAASAAPPKTAPLPAARKEPQPPAAPAINTSPLARLQERQKYPNFTRSRVSRCCSSPPGNS